LSTVCFDLRYLLNHQTEKHTDDNVLQQQTNYHPPTLDATTMIEPADILTYMSDWTRCLCTCNAYILHHAEHNRMQQSLGTWSTANETLSLPIPLRMLSLAQVKKRKTRPRPSARSGSQTERGNKNPPSSQQNPTPPNTTAVRHGHNTLSSPKRKDRRSPQQSQPACP
jgi:hypothetical protein